MKTVILANGSFPRQGGAARRLLESAGRIVACDGAADRLWRRLRRRADFTVGDLDSLAGGAGAAGAGVVRIAEQETNDLAKAIGFCRRRGWRDLVIVGATGRREDHTLGNVFRAMEAGVEMVTDEGRFVPLKGRLALDVAVGTPVSVFTADPRARMTSRGLVWPLDGVVFDRLYRATLNRAGASRVVITSTAPGYVFITEKPQGERS